MIIWGYKGYQKNVGQTQSNIECANCHNVAPWDIIETVVVLDKALRFVYC